MRVLKGYVKLYSDDNPDGLLEDLKEAEAENEEVRLEILGNAYYVKIETIL